MVGVRRLSWGRAFRRDVLFVVGAAVSFALLPVFFSLLSLDNAGIAVQVSARVSVGSLFILLLNLSAGMGRGGFRIQRSQLLLFAANGLILLGAFTTYNLSVGLGTSPAKAILLIFMNPLITVVLSRLFLREKLTRRKVLATICGVIGIVLAMEFWTIADLFTLRFSDLLALFNGLLSSLVLIFGRKSNLLRGVAPLVALQYSFLFALFWIGVITAGVALVAPAAAGEMWRLTLTPAAAVLLLAVGLFGTGIAYTLLYTGLRTVEASLSAILLLFEPVMVFVFQALLLDVPITIWQVVGGTILLLSGYWAQARH